MPSNSSDHLSEIGPGIYDINSPNVPSEMQNLESTKQAENIPSVRWGQTRQPNSEAN